MIKCCSGYFIPQNYKMTVLYNSIQKSDSTDNSFFGKYVSLHYIWGNIKIGSYRILEQVQEQNMKIYVE